MNYFIFDMDGVLVDSEPMHKKILLEVCQNLQISVDSTYFETTTGMAAIPLWTKIKNDKNLSQSAEELSAYHKTYFFERFPSLEVSEVKGVISLIRRLKANGFSLSVASSSSRKLIDLFLNQLNISHYFDFIVSGEELKRSKPFPDIFLKVAEIYKVSPEMFWVLEDSKHGVAAAKSAGMRCIGFRNPNSGNQDLSQADIIIDKMDTITDEFIQKLTD